MKRISKSAFMEIINSFGNGWKVRQEFVIFATGNHGYRDIYFRDNQDILWLDVDYKSGGKCFCYDVR